MPSDSFALRNADTLALTAGVVLALIILAAYIFGIKDLASDLNQTLDPNSATPPAPTYDLESARSLNLKGLSPER